MFHSPGSLFMFLYDQAYSAALQTQWQWVNQLCVCVEQHLKDNTAYFQVRQLTRNKYHCTQNLETYCSIGRI